MSSPGGTSSAQPPRDFSRQNRSVDERNRSTSGSYADPADNDASMSNDESMSSSSSSLEIESHLAQHVQQLEQQSDERGSSRPNGLDEFARQLPYQDLGTSHAHAAVSSFAVEEENASSSPERPSRPKCWLLTQFAPAMSKTMKSSDSSGDMEDDEPFEEDSERVRGNRRVAWASTAHLELSDGVQLTAAKNEVTGVQVRLKSNVLFMVTTDTSNWLLPRGHGHRARLAVDTRFVPPHLVQFELFVLGTVEDENATLVMETLERTGVTLKASKDHGVYLRIRIAETIDPGVYDVPVCVFTQATGFRDEHLTWSSSISLHVVDVCLPRPSQWRFRLDLWQHWTAVARAHRVALWSDDHFDLIDRYLVPLSEMGQKCLSIVATEMPWAGQQCYMEEQNASSLFEHAILAVYEDRAHDVPLTIDFTHFDRLLELGARHQVDEEIEVFGLLSVWRDPAAGFDAPAELTVHHVQPATDAPTGAVRPRNASSGSEPVSPTAKSLSSTSGNTFKPQDALRAAQSLPFVIDGWRIRCQDRTTQTVRYLTQVSEVEVFIQQFYKHCVALEIVDRVRICADEPRDVAVFHEQLRFLQRLAPDFRLKLAVNHSEFFSPTFAPPQVAEYVPLLPLACADLEVTRRLANDARARGGHVCWYVCCSPAFPNQFVSSPLVEGELVGYLTFLFELDGFLRWNYCLWPARPWDDLRWRAPMWKVGDMYFVLPGLDGRPVETLRLESLRFAGQAFELLALARDTLASAQMQQLQRTVVEEILRSSDLEEFGRSHDRAREDLYSLDPLDYQRAKTIILDTLAAAAVKNGAM